MNRLNSEQQRAVTVSNCHALVLAGAGSGKTFTIIERILYLLKKGVEPGKILVITFTRRAAEEIKERLNKTEPALAPLLNAGTFHSFCLYAIRSHPKFFEQESAALIIDRDDQVALMRECRTAAIKELKILKETHKEFFQVSKLVNIFSYARSTTQNLSSYLEKFVLPAFERAWTKGKIDLFRKYIINTLERYEQQKRDKKYIDFDDILIAFATKLKADTKIKDHFKQFFAHILVDEIQDTNILQWQILSELADPAWLYCVGDDAQSIYAFRGANVKNMRQFRSNFQPVQELKLAQNYRSTQSILNLANRLLADSTIDYAKELKAIKAVGKNPEVRDFASAEDEALWIVEDIKNSIALEPESIGQIMVLTRTARGAKILETRLTDYKIPYIFIGGQSFLNAAHVKDLLAACRAGVYFKDSLAWSRFLCLFEGIGPVSANKVIAVIESFNADKAKIVDYLQKNKTLDPIVLDCLELAWSEDKHPSKIISGIANLLDSVLESKYDNWSSRKRDWEILATAAERFSAFDLFLDTYALDPITPTMAERGTHKSSLRVVTAHSAKGLESNTCYIIQAQSGSFPHSLAQTTEEIEEERRILYVAITRAKDRLVITRQISVKEYLSQSEPERPDFFQAIIDQGSVVEYHKPDFRSKQRSVFRF